VPTRKIQDMLVRNMKRRNKTNIWNLFVLVNKYVMACLFIYFKKRRNPFYDPDRDVPSSSFLNSEDTPIASEMH
jgi:hypothetical protein